MDVNDVNMEVFIKTILKNAFLGNKKKCTCKDTCTCKKNDFEGQRIKMNTECHESTYDPATDEMWNTPQSTENEMRWIIRLFKAWYTGNEEKVNTLLKDINDSEIEAIASFAMRIVDHLDSREKEGALADDVDWKVKSILSIRKAKYDWVTYNHLHNLVCTNIDIDAKDKRVDETVAKDFFESAYEKLNKGEEIEIDLSDFNALVPYIEDISNKYTIIYNNGKVSAKF